MEMEYFNVHPSFGTVALEVERICPRLHHICSNISTILSLASSAQTTPTAGVELFFLSYFT